VRHGVNYQKDVGSPMIDGGSANWKTMRLAKKDGRYCAAHKMGCNVLYALGMTKTSQPLNPEGHGLVNTFKRWAAFVKHSLNLSLYLECLLTLRCNNNLL
jgi:hypothetical protein